MRQIDATLILKGPDIPGEQEVNIMLSDRIMNLINYQINKELESAYLYLDFANYFNENGLKGFEHWYKVQAFEEIEHAEKFIEYMHDEGSSVKLKEIAKPECACESIEDVLSKGLQHEMYVTKLIKDLYDEAENQYDTRTVRFLDWFINEQAEEEKNAKELIENYENFASDCKAGLYMLDKQLGERSD